MLPLGASAATASAVPNASWVMIEPVPSSRHASAWLVAGRAAQTHSSIGKQRLVSDIGVNTPRSIT
jgi:hypothetical protein